LELPIDHFRLLGVSATTDGQTVLRVLQQRLERPPGQGFTHETLQARAELLRQSANLLSDDDRRQEYERKLTSVPAGGSLAGLEIRPSFEVGGLLLLLEAGQPYEAFEAARRALQPPQAPSLGSGRETDLTLLVGVACQAAAAEYRQQRRFETAARTLQQGLQQLQRMGQLTELRQELDRDLRALQPYRVLDLICRDLSAKTERQAGLELLNDLVKQRGGLDAETDHLFNAGEFGAFFAQIRAFLTAQEQVDLFSGWAEAGSAKADLLAAIAMTAAGFVQRKPERIQTALQRLQSGAHSGARGVMACQQLLLGRVDQARQLFGDDHQSIPADGALSDEGLADLCAACQLWLRNEVLPGFRDIEAEADLEAWFADRDVQLYIEQQDRIRGRQPLEPGAAGVSTPAGAGLSVDAPAGPSSAPERVGSATEEVRAEAMADDGEIPLLPWHDWNLQARLEAGLSWLNDRRRSPMAPKVALGAAAVLVVGSVAWLSLRPRERVAAPTSASRPVQPVPPAASRPVPPAATPTLPLTRPEPSAAELQALLEGWLQAKASLLAGRQASTPLNTLARPALIQELERKQAENRRDGISETITAQVEGFEIRSRGPGRISAVVRLRYSDERRNAAGRVLARTPADELRNLYVFARDGNTWYLADFRPER
jgi:hypothetical protein